MGPGRVECFGVDVEAIRRTNCMGAFGPGEQTASGTGAKPTPTCKHRGALPGGTCHWRRADVMQVVVLGMHRSGTSMVSRELNNRLGAVSEKVGVPAVETSTGHRGQRHRLSFTPAPKNIAMYAPGTAIRKWRRGDSFDRMKQPMANGSHPSPRSSTITCIRLSFRQAGRSLSDEKSQVHSTPSGPGHRPVWTNEKDI
jgi:hypothetical protein